MDVSARSVHLALAEPFTISRGSQDSAHLVEVEVRHGRVSGFGEAAPEERYGESPESALAYIEDSAGSLGDDPFALSEVMDRLPKEQFAARAAIDAALHDLCGKLANQPVWRYLSLPRVGPPTSWTIVLAAPDEMAAKAARIDATGRFRRLKLKLGGRDGLDVARVQAVREVTDLPLQVDVNEYWSLDEALEALPQLRNLGVEYCEQPLPAGDPQSETLKRMAALPVYVDEDCHTLADVARCATIAHGINIKLVKSGGIAEALRMVYAARSAGLGVMIGCMVESGLGVAAGAVLAGLCDYVDLDTNLMLRHDPWPGVTLQDGVQTPSDEPGLGVHRAG